MILFPTLEAARLAIAPNHIFTKCQLPRVRSQVQTAAARVSQQKDSCSSRRCNDTKLSASLSLFSALTLSSHAHLWSLKLSLKMRVSSNELFSTLKITRLTEAVLVERQTGIVAYPWQISSVTDGKSATRTLDMSLFLSPGQLRFLVWQ